MVKIKTLGKIIAGIVIPSIIVYSLHKGTNYFVKLQLETGSFITNSKAEIMITDDNNNSNIFYKKNDLYRDLLDNKRIYIEDVNRDSLDDLVVKSKALGLFEGTSVLYGQKDKTYKNYSKILADYEEKKGALEKKLKDDLKEDLRRIKEKYPFER